VLAVLHANGLYTVAYKQTASERFSLRNCLIYSFFVIFRHYEINVESIYIEEPNSTRPPQYAHVTFFNSEHVEYVLKGQAKVKFRTNGKHLWARRFIPRRRRRWGRNAN
jgi:hypothetical protein